MTKKDKPVKVDSQIRVMKRDLKDMIRDELYGAGVSFEDEFVCIPKKKVAEIAKHIAKRATIGH